MKRSMRSWLRNLRETEKPLGHQLQKDAEKLCLEDARGVGVGRRGSLFSSTPFLFPRKSLSGLNCWASFVVSSRLFL